MRHGFEPPIKTQYPIIAHPPLFVRNGDAIRRKPGYKQYVAPTNGKSVNQVIQTKALENNEPEANKASVQTVDITKDIFTVGELLSLKYDGYPYLLEKFIPKGVITFIAGSSDVGKSLFYTNLALNIITDKREFIGQKINLTYGKVLLISTEDGPIGLSDRMNKQMNGEKLLKKQEDRMLILINTDRLIDRIKHILARYSVDLIVLDAFGDVFDGDINTSNQVRIYLDKFDNLIKKYNTSMLIIHHIAKAKENQAANKGQLLGSGALEGRARQVLILSKDASKPSKRTLKVVKGNYASEEDKRISYELHFDSNTLTYKSMGAAVRDLGDQIEKKAPGRKVDMEKVKKVFELHKEGYKGVEIAELIDMNPTTVSKWLKRYKDDFGA
jgi:RecA-family ATPase